VVIQHKIQISKLVFPIKDKATFSLIKEIKTINLINAIQEINPINAMPIAIKEIIVTLMGNKVIVTETKAITDIMGIMDMATADICYKRN
jgi:hypothetical protein